MYVGPDVVRPAPRSPPANRSVISTFSALICLGVLLFLIAATIVLALIPVYTAPKSATLNPNAFKSQLVRMLVAVENRHTTTGKKRAAGDLSKYVGYSLDANGLKQIHDQLYPIIRANGGEDLDVQSATFAYQNSGKKKRYALLRQRRANNIILTIVFRIIFGQFCSIRCQNDRGSVLRQALQNLNGTSNIILTNAGVIGGGSDVTVDTIILVAIEYVSEIFAALSSLTQGTYPTVYNATTTIATTLASTARVSG